MSVLPALALLVFAGASYAQPANIDLVSFQTDDVGAWERVHRRSDSLPLTLDDLEKLAKAGVNDAAIKEMMRTRKVLTIADADALIRLKKAGMDDATLSAVSAYAWPPNDHFDLDVRVKVTSPRGVKQAPYLYIEVHDEARKVRVAFLHADLRAVGRGADVQRDRADPMLPQTVKSIRFKASVRTRDAGPLALRVLSTRRAGLTRLDDVTGAEKAAMRTLKVDYPAVSLDQLCELDLELARDAVLRDVYSLGRADLVCRWR